MTAEEVRPYANPKNENDRKDGGEAFGVVASLLGNALDDLL